MSSSEEDRRARADRRAMARQVAAFDLLLDNLSTAAHPHKGNPVLLDRAREVLSELEPEQPE